MCGVPGWRSRLSVRLQPGPDLTVREFEPRVGLWADGSEPGACFWFCVSLCLCPSPVHALSLSVPKINKRWKKKFKKTHWCAFSRTACHLLHCSFHSTSQLFHNICPVIVFLLASVVFDEPDGSLIPVWYCQSQTVWDLQKHRARF